VLERGYAVVRTADGTVLRSAADAAPGQALDVQLAAGRLSATVDVSWPLPATERDHEARSDDQKGPSKR
jgi:exodeoxyribonuclease VII large subunit